MKNFLGSILAVAMLTSTAAYAQPRHDDHGRYEHNDRNYGRHDNDRRVHHWTRGQRLGFEYRSIHNRYHISDYRRYRLHAPRRGYHWVRVDNDYLLVALATGLIAEVVQGR